MRLLLVRHGESTWNVEGRYQGRRDAPLSARGREQAQALASRLSREGLTASANNRLRAIVSSPLRRARDTAQLCARALGFAVRADERITEICHGEWEGRLRDEIASRWPDMLAAWQTTPDLVRFPGGETLADVRERFMAFLGNVPDNAGPLFAVTHDVIVRIAVLAAAGKPLAAFNEVSVDNAALNEFSLESGKLRTIRLNDTTHLASLRSDSTKQAL